MASFGPEKPIFWFQWTTLVHGNKVKFFCTAIARNKAKPEFYIFFMHRNKANS